MVSDLHAHASDPSPSTSPSHFSTNSLYSTAGQNPLADLANVIQADGLSTDWVVSPGDLGDRAEPTAQAHAWLALEKVRSALGAANLIATAGNHDLDSRRSFPDFDPKATLQALRPFFPASIDSSSVENELYSDRYWARNFVTIPFDEHDCLLLIINSCAFHGYASEVNSPPNEHLRGRISALTVDAIRKVISEDQHRLKIALVHHHLKQLPWIQDGNSVMLGADKLIELFKQTAQQWLIIHGHQHVPHISYADASTFAPIILSSASVAAKTYSVRGTTARNQMHHITIDASLIDKTGANIKGQIRSWNWIPSLGWRPATAEGGLPFKSGFGLRSDMVALRNTVSSVAKMHKGNLTRWDDIRSLQPDIDYLTPEHLSELVTLLEKDGVIVEKDTSGIPRNLEWR